jgi:hypothetical protein
MASHEGSRKRIKISPTESKPTSSIMALPVASASSAACKSAVQGTCRHEQSLKALQTDIDAMRQIVTCKICHRLLYEPYSLACGHTYCYSCLSQWLVDGRKKTCPDCRAVVTQQPTPSYLVRELVLVFVSRNELLPDGETTEEHNNYVKEEAEVVAKDKANTDPRTGGLFKGCFKRGLRGYIGPIHDAHDGVDRCPTCHWELEEGFCNSCGVMVDPHEHSGFSDYDDESDLTDDELDHELDAEDAAAVFGADGQDDYFDNESVADDVAFIDGSLGPGPPSPHRFFGGRRHRGTSPPRQGNRDRVLIDIRSSDESEADDEDEANLPDFVVDDDNVEYASSEEDEGTDVSVNHSSARRRGPIVVVSDDDRPASASAEPTSGSEDESEDEGPVALGGHRRKREPSAGRLQRGRRTISSDEESSENEDDQESAIADHGGFSPLDSSAPGYLGSVRSGYNSDSVSTVHPMDDEDGYEGHIYHDENDEDDNESDGSDSETGWGPVFPD